VTDDRSDLIDRTTLREVDPETGAVRATLSYGGRTVDFSPERVEAALASLGRERRNPPDHATRDGRVEGYIGPGDADDLWPPTTYHGSVHTGRRTVYLPFGESRDLAELGAALIDRDKMLQAIDTWEIRVAYLRGEDLGKAAGEPRLWRRKKADPLSTTSLGMCSPPRVVGIFLFLNSLVVSFAELSLWQVQATLHVALGDIRLKDGRASIEALSSFWQSHTMRRYGARWRPDLASSPR
jgi:hypothetical protein